MIEKFKKYDKFYILKIDISKYFYNIDHKVLKELLIYKLNIDEYKIICNIIETTNEYYINNEVTKIKERLAKISKTRLKEVNNIPSISKGK